MDDPETPGALALIALADAVRAAVERYAIEANVPHAPRLSGGARLDIWAVVLSNGAREDWHVHPSGAVSGVYYVAAPPKAGALQFGLLPFPPENLAAEPALTLVPEAGTLVLFPSSFAHRALPTDGTAPRISVAFDAVPV